MVLQGLGSGYNACYIFQDNIQVILWVVHSENRPKTQDKRSFLLGLQRAHESRQYQTKIKECSASTTQDTGETKAVHEQATEQSTSRP